MKSSNMAVQTAGILLIEDKAATREHVNQAIEKIYILPEVAPELLKALGTFQLHLEEYYEASVKSKDDRKKAFYAEYLKAFPMLEKLGTPEFEEDKELRRLVLDRYKKVTEDLERTFGQFRVDGNSRRVIEIHQLIDDFKKIKVVARKHGIEI